MTIAAALELSGMGAADAAAVEQQFARVLPELDRQAGPAGERIAWFVPGRIEMLGKHTDYAGGRSLICAASRGFAVAAAPRADDRISITDVARGAAIVTSFGGHVPGGRHQRWFAYPQTVVARLARNFPAARRGADIVFESSLPSAAGMSSSSALMVAVLLALADVNALDRLEAWRGQVRSCEDLAAFAATIENGRSFGTFEGDAGVGTAGGSEDHTAILCGRAGRLSQYSFLPVRFERAVPLDPGLAIVIGVTGVVANKIGEARERYNSASAAAAAVLDLWRSATGRTDESLAAAILSGADAAGRIRAMIRGAGDDAPRLLARFDQFVEESEIIVPRAADQLAAGDIAGFGATVDRSQQLAEQLLGNQVPETVALARSARACGALAASAFGAGFGGSVWALVDAGGAREFVERWSAAYRTGFPVLADRAQFFVTRPGPPATRIPLQARS